MIPAWAPAPLPNGPAEPLPREATAHRAQGVPRIVLIAPSLRIMGGQSVMADRLLVDMRGDGVSVDLLPINPRRPWPFDLAEKVKYSRTLVVSAVYFTSLLQRVRKYDVIHLFSASYIPFIISRAPAILVATLFGKPIILNDHSGECEVHLRKWGSSIFWLLLKCAIVVQTEHLAKAFAKFGLSARVIPNNVDLASLPYLSRLPIPANAQILVPRALEPLYNVEGAIRAFSHVQKKFPLVRLTILGEGQKRGYLEQLVSDKQLTGVTFAGRVERTQVAVYYASYDICLDTSSIDNTPVSSLETYACGLPVVTTAAGGIPYIVSDQKTGYLAPVGDHDAVADRLIRVMEKPTEIEPMIVNARREHADYAWPAVAEAWYAVYRRLSHPITRDAPGRRGWYLNPC